MGEGHRESRHQTRASAPYGLRYTIAYSEDHVSMCALSVIVEEGTLSSVRAFGFGRRVDIELPFAGRAVRLTESNLIDEHRNCVKCQV